MDQNGAALDMAEEAVAKAGALMRALDQAGDVGDDEFFGCAPETTDKNVDLPAFGMPTRPTSAISFRRSQTQRPSPGQPLSAWRGARLVEVLKRALPKPPSPPRRSVIFLPGSSRSARIVSRLSSVGRSASG